MTLVVVGAGLAGAKAAEAARATGFAGRVLLVGEEHSPPYERPPLSKQVLKGEKPPESARVHPEGFYDEQRIELRTGERVTGLDLADRTVHVGDEVVPYDRLVLATGARPRRLGIPGADLEGVHYLRTVEDSVRLAEAARSAGRVAVVGGGWIGSEVAASLRQLGADVVVVDPMPTPLHGVLGPEVGASFAQLHKAHGVQLRMGVGVASLRGSGRVDGVVLADGSTEAADVVVVGVGALPNTELAEAAGLAVDNGVVVDERLQTAVPGVLATGDVASAFHPRYGRHVRVEHWANALNQGAAAGRNAVGEPEVYDRLPYFYSDQYDLGMEYVGLAGRDDSVTVRGDREGLQFLAFYHRDGRVTAALTVNVWDVVDDLKAIITTGWEVDEGVLADPDIPLNDLRGGG
ncbi:MAG TPA: FAD/NAD(P)-binding oxidoreductase [Mycobacteriales bacterium]|nr:FAD/NAD(P)-binding oxidoreductase [Mycobacteriales bacterium]